MSRAPPKHTTDDHRLIALEPARPITIVVPSARRAERVQHVAATEDSPAFANSLEGLQFLCGYILVFQGYALVACLRIRQLMLKPAFVKRAQG
jgi:hypothetical protein